MEEHQGYALDADVTDKPYQEFINQQFPITFIQEHIPEFVDALLQKINEVGQSISLYGNLKNSIICDLEDIRVRTVDTHKLADLEDIKNDLKRIKEKNWST